MGKVVVGYVARPEGRAAVEAAATEAKRRDLELIVVHSMPGGDKTGLDQVVAYRDRLEAIEEYLTQGEIPYQVHEYVRGQKPAEDVIQAAKEFDAELVVIGLRKRTPTGKFLLGSTARDILLSSSCPVLAVPIPKT